MFNIGTQELLLILLLVFLFFGPRHLPGVARTLGKGLGDFQRTLHGVEDNFRRATEEAGQITKPMASIFDPELSQDVPQAPTKQRLEGPGGATPGQAAAVAAGTLPSGASAGGEATAAERGSDRDEDLEPPEMNGVAVNPS